MGILTLIVLGVVSCGHPKNRYREDPVARVYNKYLYPSDLKSIIPEGTPAQDSLRIAQSYTNQWIRKMVLLNQAEFNLTPEQQDVSQLLEEYRSTLLIYEYEKVYLLQELDTLVSEDEIETYYNEHLENFQLADPIIKGVYFQIPSGSEYLAEIRRNIRSSRTQDYALLSEVVAEATSEVESFDESWISFTHLIQRLPWIVENPVQFLRNNRYVEIEDEETLHFIRILDFKLPGETTPLAYISDQVKDIILNRRKVDFIKTLESSLYDDAVLQNQIEIYE